MGINGMLGGLQTLGWAIVLFVMTVYVIALVFRETLGREEVYEFIFPYFNSVPRSMFTVFRCSFGDCSTGGGTPLFEHVTDQRGWLAALGYCLFIFVVPVGLFNVIAAI